MTSIEDFVKLNFLYKCFKSELKVFKATEGQKWHQSQAKLYLCVITGYIKKELVTMDKGNEKYTRIIAMLGSLLYQEAKVLEELGVKEGALTLLKFGLCQVENFITYPIVMHVGFKILNHLCYLLINKNELLEAKSYLMFGQNVYRQLEIVENNKCFMFSNDELFQPTLDLCNQKNSNKEFEKLFTLNLQMLGFVFYQLGEMIEFSLYHHVVLNRQLILRSGDPVIWAMKTGRLGFFFLTHNKFPEARHHLAAACHVLALYECNLKLLDVNESWVLYKWEELNRQYYELAKCWVKYGLALFWASILKLATFQDNLPEPFPTNFDPRFSNGCPEMINVFDENCLRDFEESEVRDCIGEHKLEINFRGEKNESFCICLSIMQELWIYVLSDLDRENVNAESPPLNSVSSLRFESLNLKHFEDHAICYFVSNHKEARSLFIFTDSWIRNTKQFLTIRTHHAEYISIILDQCELYKYLAFFEDNIEFQYLIQKLRADCLENLVIDLQEIKPPCYITSSAEILRMLAEVQLDLIQLNMKRIENRNGKY